MDIVDIELTVTKDRKLRLQSTKLGKNLANTPAFDTKLELGSLQERTITILINWLRSHKLDDQGIRLLGEYLYDGLLSNKAGEILSEQSRDKNKFLRVELQFENAKDDIANWPWEYLYRFPSPGSDDGVFIANETRFAIIRRPPYDIRRSLRVTDPLVKVLLVAASPCCDESLPRLEFDKLLNDIENLEWELESGQKTRRRFELRSLLTRYLSEDDRLADQAKPANDRKPNQATWEGFKHALNDFKPHVIHFLGHGKFEKETGTGKIAFAADNYGVDWKTGEQLSKALDDLGSISLVFLQACDTAQAAQNSLTPYQALSSVATRLASVSIPAVIAMQSEVEVAPANHFAKAFYAGLVGLRPVYQAVQEGRQELNMGTSAFGIPVLYLLRYNNEEGQLFPVQKSDTTSAGGGSIPPDRTVITQAGTQCPRCGRMTQSTKTCSYCKCPLKCEHCNEPITRKIDEDEVLCECPVCGKETPIPPRPDMPSKPDMPSNQDGFVQQESRLDLGVGGRVS